MWARLGLRDSVRQQSRGGHSHFCGAGWSLGCCLTQAHRPCQVCIRDCCCGVSSWVRGGRVRMGGVVHGVIRGAVMHIVDLV